MEKGCVIKVKDEIIVPFNHLLSLGRLVKMISLFGLCNMVTGNIKIKVILILSVRHKECWMKFIKKAG
jgi:hypothetical protein